MERPILWKGHEVLYLKKKYPNTPYEEMMKFLGRSKQSIIGAGRRLGLVRTPNRPSVWNETTTAIVEREWGNGKSASAIAQILGSGFTKNMVIGKAHRMNLAKRVNKLSPEMKIARAIATEQRRLAMIRARAEREANKKPVILPVTISRRDSLNILLKDTKKNQCRYMAGNDHKCCGHKTMDGLSWCDFHYKVVYRDDRRSPAVARFN